MEDSSQAFTSECQDAKNSVDSNSPAVLKDVINSTIDRSLRALNGATFSDAYPVICKTKKSKKRTNELRKATINSITENTREEIGLIFQELSVEEKLTELDKAIKESKSTKKTWRPTDDVEKDLRPHIMQTKSEYLNELKAILRAEKLATRELEIKNNKKKEQLNLLVRQARQIHTEFIISDD